MKIKDFGVEIWMNTYENDCTYNLAETCVRPMTVGELLDLAGNREEILQEITQMQMTYGDIEGSPALRQAVCGLFHTMKPENITITHGGIGANALTIMTLVEPGDRVISVLPTYQQHYSIPESIGAEVKILRLRKENGFLPDLNELRSYATKNTKLICINNPNNPTGAVMDRQFLEEIVAIARECDAYLLCDEVYRGLIHEGDSFGPSIADLYEKGISTGSTSKAYSLAGLRLGWIAGPEELTHQLSKHRDYHVISVGRINDKLAAVAMENKDKIIARNLEIVRKNAALLDEWVAGEPLISYTKPQGGTTALLKLEFSMGAEEFCIRLQKEKGVMMLPGTVLDMEGHVRIGYCDTYEGLKKGLELTSEFLKELAQ